MTATTIPEFFRIIRAYWFIGNHETQMLVRQIIMWGLGGGALLVCVSFLGIPALTAIIALALILGGPARILWKFSYPLSVPIGAIALPKIDEETWDLVKKVCVWALQALAIFGVFALYFSSPLSPLANLSFLERISVAPVLVLAFVVAGLCALVGWRQQGVAILVVTAAFSLALRVGGWAGLEKGANHIVDKIAAVENSGQLAHVQIAQVPLAPNTKGAETTPTSEMLPLVNVDVGRRQHLNASDAASTNATGIVREPGGTRALPLMGQGNDYITFSDVTRWASLAIPQNATTNAPTAWVVKPRNADRYEPIVQTKMWVQTLFADGSMGEWMGTSPVAPLSGTFSPVRAMRFAVANPNASVPLTIRFRGPN